MTATIFAKAISEKLPNRIGQNLRKSAVLPHFVLAVNTVSICIHNNYINIPKTKKVSQVS